MKKLILILSMLLSGALLAQDTGSIQVKAFEAEMLKSVQGVEDERGNPRANRRLGINMTVGGPAGVLSLSADYFITPSINIEAGVGYFGIFGGGTYHIYGENKKVNLTPYLGMYIIRTTDDCIAWCFNTTFYPSTAWYFPFGVQHMGKKGFTIGAEVAVMLRKEEWFTLVPLWGGLKVGVHF